MINILSMKIINGFIHMQLVDVLVLIWVAHILCLFVNFLIMAVLMFHTLVYWRMNIKIWLNKKNKSTNI